MKIRTGFVSNSSSSSFICHVCGEEFQGMDLCPSDADCAQCENGHIMCNSHLKDIDMTPEQVKGCEHEFDRTKVKFCSECGEPAWTEEEVDGNELSSKYCPVCQFKIYAEEEMAKYLELTRKISREVVFAEVKKINKRRRKLYESEYITHVCKEFSLTDDMLLKEVKDRFSDFDAYLKFIGA